MRPTRIHLFSVPIDAVTQAEAIERIEEFLVSERPHHVATPNNEMLVEAHHNPALRSVLQRSALNLADSTGVVMMTRLHGMHLPERVTGTDTMQRLCEKLSASSPVFLLGAAEGVAERAAKELQRRNPRLLVAGTFAGSPHAADAPDIIRRINAVKPTLLFVAYGAPAQELWIDRYLKDLPTVRVAMGVGGAFDFIAGLQKRAPLRMRSIGLEWLWRFFQQPSRWRRMWRAVVVFPWLCLFSPREGAQ